MSKQIRRRGRPKNILPPQALPGIQALDRALDVLEALATHDGVTLTELAGLLTQSTATMHRVLAALERRQYVEVNPERQEWFVGPEAFRLGSAFLRNSNIVERSRTVMRDLVAKTGETSNLGVEREGVVLFVSQMETQETIRAFIPPGTKSPLHASGIGKALLSAFDEARLDAFIAAAHLTRFTDRTIAGPEQLRREVLNIREAGYALDDEERTIGMRCVAAAIHDAYGEAVAGISVSGPTVRMPDAKVRQIGTWVAQAAADVSRRLGAAHHVGVQSAE
ncbi:HTH-type transcriptional regulator BhcR [Methylobacterium brachythecii]|uniref:IclR family acetate operon transcriptional repressor n=1 Tax=Methylobacterium brachythecii TaxID=1176177 RepID=A0A7W6AL63_9HYPH|nr:HTH-type transcriptional regulator BhcR [Methylobacterium brachythecii]MBB3903209.1 IclR family acetate operon transcriptional repressor [Methylobacterium brachythecii]GLS45988.1 IclR family transcriptional regulator [Methylobacterium brachythecii]